MKIVLAVALALTTLQGPAPQTPTTQGPPALVEGIVVRFGSSDPLATTTVELRGSQAPAAPNTLVLPPGTQLPPGFQLPPGVTIVQQAPPLLATTNAEGRFQFPSVPPGTYRVYATRETGYSPGEYGQRSPTGEGVALKVEAGQRYSEIRLAMAPVGSISGRIVDSSGNPAEYARLGLLREAYRDGMRTWLISQTALTDDRGNYRFYSLPPGKYYISAGLWDNRSTRVAFATEPTIYPNRFAGQATASAPLIIKRVLENGEFVEEIVSQVFYPGTPDIKTARAIPLRVGENIQGINFSVSGSNTSGRHIRGSVVDSATGMAAGGALVRLVPREMQGPYLTIPAATADANGQFDVAGVLPIAYSLFVTYSRGPAFGGPISVQPVGVAPPAPGQPRPAPLPPENDYLPIAAGKGDVNTVRLSASLAVNVPWRGSFDDGVDDAAIAKLRITLTRDPDIIGPRPGNTVATQGWTGLPDGFIQPPSVQTAAGFVLANVTFGEYRLSVTGLPPGSYLKSIRHDTTDVLRDGLRILGPIENPIEIVLGKTGGQMEGRVFNRDKQPEANVPVVLVPTNRARKDLFQKTSTDANGRFKFDGILPDQYKVFAWEDIVAGAWQDPEFLRTYETRGVTVSVSNNRPATVEVEMIPWSDAQ